MPRPPIWQYIKTNLRVSFTAWEKGERMSIVLGALIALAFAAFALWGFQISWDSWAVNSWVALLGAWFLCLVLIVTPYRLWAEQKKRIDEFETSLVPKLEIIHTIQDFQQTMEPDYFLSWNASVGVQSQSNSTVHGVELVLESAVSEETPERESHHIQGRLLPKEAGAVRTSINPLDTKHYDVAKAKLLAAGRDEQGQIFLGPLGERRNWFSLSDGLHTITLRVSGEDSPPRIRKFRTGLTGERHFIFESLPDENAEENADGTR
jgi:hypothetical protein